MNDIHLKKKAHRYENIYQDFLLYFNSEDKKGHFPQVIQKVLLSVIVQINTCLKIRPSIPNKENK